ncbi:hypothetical protein ACM66B_001581 [Microbotryomycetes sp. NB124-2]
MKSVVLLALLARHATAQLAAQRFDYNALPEKTDTSSGERGPQVGYNRCSPETEGLNSLCQTALINSIDDFCLWAPPNPGRTVGDIEGEMVAWCTRPGRGARTIPDGALTGVQFLRAKNYVQVVGKMDQTKLNMIAGDSGGEMDPHGADQRGNPIGGLLFSNAWGRSSSGAAFQQVINWHNFMGSDTFCLKACNPSWDYDYRMCEHIYDRSGCAVNAPAAYRDGVFESCLSDDQLAPGIYVGLNGQTSTWTQGPEGTPLGDLPYVPFTPASSQCTAYQSAALYNGQPVSDGVSGPISTGLAGSLSASASSGSTDASMSVSSSSASSTAESSVASSALSTFSSAPVSSALPSSSSFSSVASSSSVVSMSPQTTSLPPAPVVTEIVTSDASAEPASETAQPTSSAGRLAFVTSLSVILLVVASVG